jgi:signal transduction histidine kinase
MKLINKITLWYLVITLFTLLLGGVLVFYSVQQELKEENERLLKDAVEYIAGNLQKGLPVESLPEIHIVITKISLHAPPVRLRFSDTAVWFPPHQHFESALYASSSYKINGNHYLITASTVTSEPDEITSGVTWSLSWVFIALLILIVVCNRAISGRLFAPFNKTLRSIESFNLQDPEEIHFPKSTTEEFTQLNRFLDQMIKKSTSDYKALKEFTENAAHELRTPLAIVRGKLELLMESDINAEQAELLESAHRSIGHLAAIHESLSLLTKLENNEYAGTAPVNFSWMLQVVWGEFSELAEMKNIAIESHIEKDVLVHANVSLTRILISNLLNNAIRHNFQHGKIWINLSAQRLVVSNTGTAPQVPTEQLFQRFKKGAQSSDSIGLGLAIVRQICTLNHFSADYRYHDAKHVLTISFNN